jgi:hypothetical protein
MINITKARIIGQLRIPVIHYTAFIISGYHPNELNKAKRWIVWGTA